VGRFRAGQGLFWHGLNWASRLRRLQLRALPQPEGLDETVTDSFGRTQDIDRRSDVQLQKVNLTFKGWMLDPNFRYKFYVWTSNSNQGQGAQVVVAGNLNYVFNENLTLGAGIDALPTTRTTNGTFPNWLKVDHRTMADEYFRGSTPAASGPTGR
jgi:hypothetical protein